MAMDFKRSRGKALSRMLVGYRRRDWRSVWYSPILESEDEDGGAALALFQSERGVELFRNPMEGEVHWVPFFDTTNHESSLKKERQKMQCQTLLDCWRYLQEKDEEKLEEMEERFDDPQTARQYAWFTEAKKWKKRDKKTRKKTRQVRETMIRDWGLSPEEMEQAQSQLVSDDSDDSGFDEDESSLPRRERTRTPPKRKTSGRGQGGRGSKKSRSSRHSEDDAMGGARSSKGAEETLFLSDEEDNGSRSGRDNGEGRSREGEDDGQNDCETEDPDEEHRDLRSPQDDAQDNHVTEDLDDEDMGVRPPQHDNSHDGDAAKT